MRPAMMMIGAALLWALSFTNGCTAFKRWAYEGGSRDSWQHADEVIRVLQIQPGARVADVGAGGGYFTFRLANAVGASGTVYAVDIDRGMTDYLKERAAEEGYRNVDVVLATPDDPQLPRDGIDLIFTCNTYHHFDKAPDYFAAAKLYLRAGGRVAIIDYKYDGFFARLFGHASEGNTIREDMLAAGYRLEHEYSFLPRQNFLVFVKG